MARGKEGKFSTWVLCIMRAQHGCSYAASVAPQTWHVALASRSQTGLIPQRAIISAHMLSALYHWLKPRRHNGASRGSATAAPVAPLFMAGCVCRRGERGRRLAKTWPISVLVCFQLSLSYHHRFPMFLVKKKNSWASHSEHFMFSSFLVLIRQELQGEALQQLERVWKKEALLCWEPQKKAAKWKKMFSATWKCWVYLLLLLRSMKAWWYPHHAHPAAQVCFSGRLLPLALPHNGHCCIHMVKWI